MVCMLMKLHALIKAE